MVVKGADALIGPVASASAGPASLISGISKIPLVAYISTAPSLSDKSTYPYFARTCMSDLKLIENIVKVCRELGWSSVSVLYQNDQWGKGIAEAINTAGGQLDMKIITSQQFDPNSQASIQSAVEAAAAYGGRVYIFAKWIGEDEDLFFAADDAGIIGPGYAWVDAGGAGDPHAMTMASSDPPRMERVLAGQLQVSEVALFGDRETKFTAALQEQDPEALYHPEMGDKAEALPVLTTGGNSGMCAYAYDATIAAGLALARANWSDAGHVDREHVLDLLRHTDFHGATGHVEMDPVTGDRQPDGITMVMTTYVPTFAEGDGEPTMVSRRVGVFEKGSMVKLAEPYWAGGFEGWDNVPSDGFQCEAGWALSETTLKCEACPAGTEQRGSNCHPCDMGRFAPEAGTVACPKCAEGYANETGQELCHQCPLNTYRPANTLGVSIIECVCNPGTYSRSGPGTPCEECPAGAVCEGGVQTPYPQQGFWGDKRCSAFGGDVDCPEWFEFMECTHSDCAGGPDFACADGRSGRLCKDTANGWYNVGRIVFLECRNGGTAWAFLGIVGVVLAWCAIVAASITHASIDVLTQFMLVNAMIATYGLKWHSKLNGLNVFLKIANFDVDFVSPGCFGAWRPEHSFFLQLFLPVIVSLLYVAALFVYRQLRRGSTGHSLSANGIKLFIALTITMYHTAIFKSFSTFRCELYPDGKEYLALHPGVECWKSSHISMVVLGVLWIIFGGLCVPAFLWLRVRKHRKEGTLQDAEVDFTYGWQHRRYTMQWKNWWAVVCFRRFAVAVIAAVVPWSMVQAMATVFLIMALLTAQVMVRPHASARIDLLEFFSKVMTNLYVLGGMLMYGSITTKAQGRVCAEDASGVDLQFCAAELQVKDGISVFSLVCMAATLCFAGFLAFTLAWDDRNAFRASKLLGRWHKSRCTTRSKSGDDEDAIDHSSLGHLLNSVPVLRYISTVSVTDAGSEQSGSTRHDEEQGKNVEVADALSAEEYAELEQGLSDLARHFNSSKSVRADILGKICSTPGVLEWVAVEEGGRDCMLRFVNGLANFLRREKQVKLEQRANSASSFELQKALSISSLDGAAPTPRARRGSLALSVMDLTMQMANSATGSKTQASFPVSELIKKECLGTATYYMMTCSERNRRSFCTLLDAILRSSDPAAPSIRDFARSSSASSSSLPLREPSASKLRRLSLDDYQPESAPEFPPSSPSSVRPRRTSSPAPRAQARKTSQVPSQPPSSELYVQAQLVTPRDIATEVSAVPYAAAEPPETPLGDEGGGIADGLRQAQSPQGRAQAPVRAPLLAPPSPKGAAESQLAEGSQAPAVPVHSNPGYETCRDH